jgi:hypothetical protein
MAGTTGSSGLNNLLTDTNQVQTTLPSWMDAAQQSVINKAGTAAGAAPAFSATTAQNAVDALQGANNPFAQGQTNLNTIATGAANPWIVNPTTGAVTPNTNTALGGLFQAENQQLNQILPTQTASAEAGAIGSGNFGSLRGQTAVDTAKANALATLQAQQMTSALQNQATGAQAASGLGTLGGQANTANLTTGAAQMNAPFQSATNYANLINAINAPATVSTQNQMSPLSMLGSLSSVPAAASGLLGSLGITGSSFGGLGNSIMSGINGIINPTSTSAAIDAAGQGKTTVPIDTTGMNLGNAVAGTGAGGGAGAGQIFGQDGNIYTDPTYGTGSGSVASNPSFNPYENPI